MFGLFEN
jgi:hypothetical protein